MQALFILVRWQMRQLQWMNWLMACGAFMFALLSAIPLMFFQSPFLMLLVGIHCAAMVLTLGRSEPRGPGFLYAQGFSRNQLWWSTFLATLLSGVLVCAMFWLAIATGLRALIQNAIGNPWFPVIGTIEASAALGFLIEYAILLPPLHYVWVRARQPQSDAAAGWTLAAAVIIYYCTCYGLMGQLLTSSIALLVAEVSAPALTMLVACWAFHPQVEVQS
jgi:hypothetical protein